MERMKILVLIEYEQKYKNLLLKICEYVLLLLGFCSAEFSKRMLGNLMLQLCVIKK